jgi:hypothetical protein
MEMIRYLLGADTVIDPWTMVVVDSDASFASIAVSRSLWFYYHAIRTDVVEITQRFYFRQKLFFTVHLYVTRINQVRSDKK